MTSLKIIKKRITSVKSTQKITRAMKLVSAAKLRRAQERAQQSRPFEKQLMEMVSGILAETRWESPLKEVRPVRRTAFVVFSTDRGLCGSLNANILKPVLRRAQELVGTSEVEVIALGKKGSDFLKRRGLKVVRLESDLVRTGTPTRMAEIASSLREVFTNGQYDQVEVFYPQFLSAVTQKPTRVTLLPFQVEAGRADAKMTIYEPKPEKLLNSLVPMLIDFMMYRFMLETTASEHAARMAAMESATKNSKEMIEKLTLERNRARQAVITKELMEIIGGAEAISA
jgi:F-type H+-transporting ATPase subunit gamma